MSQGNKKKGGHNKKGFKSIGSQVGSALGGHLSKQGKLGGGKGGSGLTSKSGNFSFNDFKNFVGNFFTKPGYASTMGQLTGNLSQLNQPSAWKTKQFADKNIDITNMNKSFNVNIDTQKAINSIQNETVKNWLNKHTPEAVKNLKISHQMYSPTKLMPGDKGYNPTGTGSIKLDPDTEKYLEWIARTNPQGATVSDYEKLYAKQIAQGLSLAAAMKLNPAETKSFYALINDKEDKKNTTQSTADLLKSGQTTADLLSSNKNSTTNNTMALNQAQVNQLYNDMLGRNATFGDASEYDADYWVGKTADQVKSGIKGSSEFLNRQELINAGITDEATLDKSVLAGGWKTDLHKDYTGDATAFNKGNNWTSNIQNAGGNCVQELNASNNVLGTSAAQNYATNIGNNAVGGGGGAIDGSTIPTSNWYDGYASGEEWLAANPQNGNNNNSDSSSSSFGGMDDFMRFMMLMSVMRGGGGYGGGGYGGSQYGYGGLNPGGVMQAYDPLAQLQGMGTWFKDNFGSGGATTDTVNTGTT